MKTCNKCKQTKPLTSFSKKKDSKDGLRNQCKECCKEYFKEYIQNNKELREKINKKYYQNNKEILAEQRKEYYQNNKERIAEHKKEYYQNNKERLNKVNLEYRKNRLQTDDLYKANKSISDLIRQSIKRMGYTKRSKSYQILGCTYEEFKIHIENQFAPGMSWDNKDQWHLDHIIPVSLGLTEEEVIALNHYTNFQPLWEEDNLAKSNNINWEKDPNKYNTP